MFLKQGESALRQLPSVQLRAKELITNDIKHARPFCSIFIEMPHCVPFNIAAHSYVFSAAHILSFIHCRPLHK